MGAFAESFSTAVELVVHADRDLARIVWLSLAVSGTACAIGAVFGFAGGAWLAVARIPGRRAFVVVLNTLLALPSVVVGLVVYLLLSRSGPFGSLGILFTPLAMVVAQTVLVLPIVTALTRQLIADAAHGNGEQLRSMGAGSVGTAALLLVHERLALVTVLLAAFGRAIGEVGARAGAVGRLSTDAAISAPPLRHACACAAAARSGG
jgi:tungstate transport system permease protein